MTAVGQGQKAVVAQWAQAMAAAMARQVASMWQRARKGSAVGTCSSSPGIGNGSGSGETVGGGGSKGSDGNGRGTGTGIGSSDIARGSSNEQAKAGRSRQQHWQWHSRQTQHWQRLCSRHIKRQQHSRGNR